LNASWQNIIQRSGARVEGGVAIDFGDPAAELREAASGNVVADLSHLGVLAFSGADAEDFLQGQLSCDVKGLAEGQATLGAYCTAKGRMLADFFLLRGAGGFLMILPRSLLEPIQKRLRMFVLRAKVVITDASDEWVLLGLAGAPVKSLKVDQGLAFEIPQGRTIVVAQLPAAEQLWNALVASFRPVGTPAWEWLDIRAGIPLIGPATQDQLVPQMANLELVGGVSFTKGCYPGQEIVARSQYLGKVKRRMYLASVEGGAVPRAGDALFSEDLGDQASGLVVNVQPSPEGGFDLLAVAQVASREGSVVRVGSPAGPALRFQPLPYKVE
jgi:folate-binding protein YgfZ